MSFFCGVAFGVFKGVGEGLKLFVSHSNRMSSGAPPVHGMGNFAQYLPVALVMRK